MPTASLPDAAATDDRRDALLLSLILTVAASVLSLGAVVVGFALVALSLIGVLAVPLVWGAGVCVSGWVLAAAVRERQPLLDREAHSLSDG